MKYLLLLLVPFSVFAEIQVFDTVANKEISYQQLIEKVPSSGFVLMGEFHNQKDIQKVQGKIIEDVVLDKQLFNNFQVGWEFLNYTDQDTVTHDLKKVIRNQITIEDFLNKNAGKNNLSYSPIIQAIKNKSGTLIALNIPRGIKKKLIDEGRDAIRSYLPPNFEVGGQLYRERFYKAMGQHVPPNMQEPYFEAQCLTDSVMSYKAVSAHTRPLTFIVAGSFHTDFYQGTYSRLKKLTSEDVISMKIVDGTMHTAEELKEFKAGDNEYGSYADYIVITNSHP